MSRTEQISAFLAAHGFADAQVVPLAPDAGFRRYLRLSGGPRPALLMDAPAPEDVRPFLRMAGHFASVGLCVPEIIAADEEAGLVLEEDFGDALLSVILDRENAGTLFDAAIDALLHMQAYPAPAGLPRWDAAAMRDATLGPLCDWWWPAAFGGPCPDAARADFGAALDGTLQMLRADVLVHRDYFAGNLIWLPDRSGVRRIGIIDFQGASLGDGVYDLVSLLEDARRDLSEELRERGRARFVAGQSSLDAKAFDMAFAICAGQRHLRVATQWVRLARRDGRPQYLVHGPRTWALLDRALRHPANTPLAAAMDRWIPPAMRANPPDLAV